MGFSCKFSRENQSIDLWAPWEILPWPGVSCSERLVVDVRGHVNWHRDEVGLLGGAASRFSHWDSQFWLGKTHGKMNRFWWMMTGGKFFFCETKMDGHWKHPIFRLFPHNFTEEIGFQLRKNRLLFFGPQIGETHLTLSRQVGIYPLVHHRKPDYLWNPLVSFLKRNIIFQQIVRPG